MEQGPEVFRPEINKNKTGARKGAEIGQEQEQKHEKPGSQYHGVCRHPLPPLGQEHDISELLPLKELLEVGQQQGLAVVSSLIPPINPSSRIATRLAGGGHHSLLARHRLNQATLWS